MTSSVEHQVPGLFQAVFLLETDATLLFLDEALIADIPDPRNLTVRVFAAPVFMVTAFCASISQGGACLTVTVNFLVKVFAPVRLNVTVAFPSFRPLMFSSVLHQLPAAARP